MLNTDPNMFLKAFNIDVAVPNASWTAFIALLIKLPINRHNPKVAIVIKIVNANHKSGKKCIAIIIAISLIEKIHSPRH